MPLLWLIIAIIMMFCGGMLTRCNPTPTRFSIDWFGRSMVVEASILEIIGVSLAVGACGMVLPYLRVVWQSLRERRALEREARSLRDEAAGLRRDVENAKSEQMLLEARLAEAEERYAQLQAEVRPLLTMQPEPASEPEPNGAPIEVARPRRAPRPVTSRWRRR